MFINLFKRTGIACSIALGAILTAAAICTIMSVIIPEDNSKFVTLLSNNWLIKIFKLHSGLFISSTEPLVGFSLYDISIIALFILICVTLYTTNNKKYKIGFSIAISLLILGIVIFSITQLAGRSAFMCSGLIISTILIKKEFKRKIAGTIGIAANALLLVGDFTVGSDLKLVSFLFGLGYILLILWIFMIATILTQTENQGVALN